MEDNTATPGTQIRTLRQRLEEERQEKEALQEQLRNAIHERRMEKELREKMGVGVQEAKEKLGTANRINRNLEAERSDQAKELQEQRKKIRDGAQREEDLKKERDDWKAKAEAARTAKAEAWKTKALPALQNGGVGDGTPYPKKDKGKGKGKGKGKSSDGRAFCYAYNDGTACRTTPCPFAHICQVCEGDHPRGDPKCPGPR